MSDINYYRGNFCVEIHPAPGSLVIFGASGDLAKRKLFPALYHLFRRNLLHEESRIIGCARTAYSDDAFRDHLRPFLPEGSEEQRVAFLAKIRYVAGDYSDPGFYRKLDGVLNTLEAANDLPSNRTFYLAMPASLYPAIIDKLSESGMLEESPEPDAPWRHVVLEKPFGRDFASAEELDRDLHSHMREDQIYRIDHYLGKDTVQNILMLRFANLVFEPVWNSRYIDHVQLTAAETLGAENRAGYYEQAGLLRDMFQNHMLEMLSLAAMEMPASFSPDDVRSEKVKLIKSIRPFDLKHLNETVVRGQYEGYRSEPGVAPDSRTETFVAAKLEIANWRWAGVPFYLRSGKKLAARKSEIAIVFKSIPHSIFAPIRARDMQPDTLVLKVQPNEGMELTIQAKQPGPKLCMGGVTMSFRYSDLPGGESFDAYERLLLDAMLGDQTLFIRSDSIAESWRLFTPLLENWDSLPLETYAAGSDGPESAARLLFADDREWRAL